MNIQNVEDHSIVIRFVNTPLSLLNLIDPVFLSKYNSSPPNWNYMCEWSYYICAFILFTYILFIHEKICDTCYYLSCIIVLYCSATLIFVSFLTPVFSFHISIICVHIYVRKRMSYLSFIWITVSCFLFHKNIKFLSAPQNSSELWWKSETMWFLSEPGFFFLAFSLLACQYGFFLLNFIAFFWGPKKQKQIFHNLIKFR